jgi:hypothetical protein
MKMIFKFRHTSLCLSAMLLITLLQGCKKDEETATERTSRLLRSASWELSKLTIDGTDQTSLYENMTLTVAAGTYTAVNGEPVWPASGTWKLTDATTIDRDNGTTVKIDHLDATTLTIALEWTKTTYGGGRRASVSGSHVFEMVRK